MQIIIYVEIKYFKVHFKYFNIILLKMFIKNILLNAVLKNKMHKYLSKRVK